MRPFESHLFEVRPGGGAEGTPPRLFPGSFLAGSRSSQSMRLRFLVPIAVALVAVAGWIWLPRAEAPTPSTEPDRPPEVTDSVPREAAVGERAPLHVSDEALVASPIRAIRGTVVDLDGKGLPGLRVREVGEDAEGVKSGPDGGFEIRPSAEEWALAVDEEGWTTVHPASSE